MDQDNAAFVGSEGVSDDSVPYVESVHEGRDEDVPAPFDSNTATPSLRGGCDDPVFLELAAREGMGSEGRMESSSIAERVRKRRRVDCSGRGSDSREEELHSLVEPEDDSPTFFTEGGGGGGAGGSDSGDSAIEINWKAPSFAAEEIVRFMRATPPTDVPPEGDACQEKVLDPDEFDRKRMTTPGIPSLYWVQDLGFCFRTHYFESHPVHDILSIIPPTLKYTSNNYVLFATRIIYGSDDHFHSATLDFKQGECYTSSGACSGEIRSHDCYFLGVKTDYGLPYCKSWNAFGSASEFGALLTEVYGTHTCPADNPCAFYHSEQALSLDFRKDAESCIGFISASASGSDTVPHCAFLDSIQRFFSNDDEICSIKLLNFNVVSVPNSVCTNCALTISNPNSFAAPYEEVLRQYCHWKEKEIDLSRSLLQVSSLRYFTENAPKYLSCALAGVRHGLQYDSLPRRDDGGLLVPHKFPENDIYIVTRKIGGLKRTLVNPYDFKGECIALGARADMTE